MIKLGIIGLGSMGQNHARVSAESGKFEVVGFFDTNPPENVVLNRYSDLSTLISESDALVVSSPTEFHTRHAQRVAEQHKPCLVEKPLAGSVKEARKFIKNLGRSQDWIRLGMIERFNPAVQAAKAYIRTGACGRVLAISANRESPMPKRLGPGNRVGLDLAIHDIDIAGWILDQNLVKFFSNSKTYGAQPRNDFFCGFGKTDQGVEVIVQANWRSSRKRRTIEVYGEKANLSIDLIEMTVSEQKADETPISWTAFEYSHGAKIFSSLSLAVPKVQPLLMELEQFAKFIEGGETGNLASVVDGEKMLALLGGEYE